jgi:hypothetical protein
LRIGEDAAAEDAADGDGCFRSLRFFIAANFDGDDDSFVT